MVKRVIVFTWHFSYVRNNCNILDDFLFLNYLARNYLFYRGWVGHFLNHHLRFLCESFCDKDKFSMFDLAASTLINFNDDRIVKREGGRGEGCWGRADWNGERERRTQRFWTFWSRVCWVCNKNTSRLTHSTSSLMVTSILIKLNHWYSMSFEAQSLGGSYCSRQKAFTSSMHGSICMLTWRWVRCNCLFSVRAHHIQ